MALPEILIGSKFDAKGFKQAETATDKLGKSIKNLAYSFGLVFSAQRLISFGKASVKAFAEDENAARSLGMTLKNLNLDYLGASESVNSYISNLEKQTGVLDDELRPAMDRLLRATGSLTESQKLLSLALDISAGTGKNLTTVSQGLQKAYLGNNASLGRLGVGLTKAELSTSTFLQIQERLTELFAGQATSAAESYLGSMNKLTIASNNAKEIIGKDLLDAMQMIAGDEGIGGATTAMEGFATQIGNVITGISVLAVKLKAIPGAGFIGDLLSAGAQVSGLGLLSRLGSSSKARSAGTGQQSPGQRAAIDRANKDAVRLQKTQNDLKKIDNDNTTRKLTLSGDELALKELEKKFDVERIGLYAALNQSTSGETSMRLLSLIAIKDQNAAMAGMIKKANEAEDAFGSLIEVIRASIRAMFDKISADLAQLQTLTQTGPNTPIEVQRAVIREKLNLAMPDITALQNRLGQFNGSSINTASNGSPTYIINAQGIGDQQIASVVQGAIQDLNRYGNSTTYAGAI
jgi:hypothetical protein